MPKSVISIFAILFIWFSITYFGFASPLLLPSPTAVAKNVPILLNSVNLVGDIYATTIRFISGYTGGVISGVVIGLIMGASRTAYGLLEFPVEFFRALPVTSLFPLFLLCFGTGDASKIAMVWVGVMFIIIVSTAYGVTQAPKKRFQMAQSFGASKWQIFRDIVLWEAIPQAVVGMRVALSTALIIVIISEMFIGTERGLGQRLYDSYSKSLTEDLYSIILIIGLIGYSINKMFLTIETKILFWVGK
jgi:ABC-type nitrate/sulfonate/bicarbonate transport system permease component